MTTEILNSRLEGTKLIIETAEGTRTYDSQFLVAALLVFVARSSGKIEPEESAKMIELIEDHFHLQGAESLELITTAMSELTDKPTLGMLLLTLERPCRTVTRKILPSWDSRLSLPTVTGILPRWNSSTRP